MNKFKFNLIPLHCQIGKITKMMRVVIYSILYMFGLGENPITIHKHDDYQAIQSDWQKIGMDIYKSMQRYEQQTKSN